MAIDALISELEKLNVLELVELKKTLEDKWGVTAAMPMGNFAMMAPGAGATEEAAPVVEEQTEFNVVMTDFGASKINVIKVVRELTGLGLKEAKDMVEKVPATIKEGVTKDEAEAVKAKLAEQGATVEVK